MATTAFGWPVDATHQAPTPPKAHDMDDTADDMSDSEVSPFNDMAFDEGDNDSEYAPSTASDEDNSDDDVDAEEHASLVPEEEIDSRLWSSTKEKQQWTLQFERTNAEWQRKYGCRIDSEARPEVSAKFHRERRWRRVQQVFVVFAVVAYAGQWWAVWNNYDVGRMTAPFRVEWWQGKPTAPEAPEVEKHNVTELDMAEPLAADVIESDGGTTSEVIIATNDEPLPLAISDADAKVGTTPELPEEDISVQSDVITDLEHLEDTTEVDVAADDDSTTEVSGEPDGAVPSSDDNDEVQVTLDSSANVEDELAIPAHEITMAEQVEVDSDGLVEGDEQSQGNDEPAPQDSFERDVEVDSEATMDEVEPTEDEDVVETLEDGGVVVEDLTDAALEELAQESSDQVTVDPIEWSTDIAGTELEDAEPGNTTASDEGSDVAASPVEVIVDSTLAEDIEDGSVLADPEEIPVDEQGGQGVADEGTAHEEEGQDDAAAEDLSIVDDEVIGASSDVVSDAQVAVSECTSQTASMVRTKFPSGALVPAKDACDRAVQVTEEGSSWRQRALVSRGDLKSFLRDFAGAINDYTTAMKSEGHIELIQLKWRSVQWIEWYSKGAVDDLAADCRRTVASGESVSTLSTLAQQWLDLVQLQNSKPVDADLIKQHLLNVFVESRKLTMTPLQ